MGPMVDVVESALDFSLSCFFSLSLFFLRIIRFCALGENEILPPGSFPNVRFSNEVK